MSIAAELPDWAAGLIALLLLAGAFLSFTGSLGLLRLHRFYDRVHAPTLGSTLGAGSIILASMLYFSLQGSRFVLHEILLAIFITVTTPVTLLLLVRAARFRDELADKKAPDDPA